MEAWSPSSAVVRRGSVVPRRGPSAIARRLVRTAAMSVVFPDREVFWAPAAIAAGSRALRARRHDVVLATHGPATNLIVGRALAARYGLPLVVDFRDLWSTLPMEIFPSRAHRATARRLERSIVRASTRLIAVAPQMATDLASVHGIPRQHAVSITNGFDPAFAARAIDDRPPGDRPFRIVYTGSVHAHYNLEPLWRVVRALADAGAIRPETFRLEFIGNLAVADVRAHGIEAFVESKPFVPHARVFDAMAHADALLVVETPGYYARYSYAAKVFDYLLTGKPVIALVERGGNTATLLDVAKVGYIAEPGDETSLRTVIERVLALKGSPPRLIDCDAEPLLSFNRRHLVAKLASVLDEVVAERSTR